MTKQPRRVNVENPSVNIHDAVVLDKIYDLQVEFDEIFGQIEYLDHTFTEGPKLNELVKLAHAIYLNLTTSGLMPTFVTFLPIEINATPDRVYSPELLERFDRELQCNTAMHDTELRSYLRSLLHEGGTNLEDLAKNFSKDQMYSAILYARQLTLNLIEARRIAQILVNRQNSHTRN